MRNYVMVLKCTIPLEDVITLMLYVECSGDLMQRESPGKCKH